MLSFLKTPTQGGRDFPPGWQAESKGLSVLLIGLGCMRLQPCPLAKAGGSKYKAEGSPHPCNRVERAERQRRSAQATARKIGDTACTRERAAAS
jgi:hypothetical protein